MVDKIVELENDEKYLILDNKELDSTNYYYALLLDKEENPTQEYLFFKEEKNGNELYLLPVTDNKIEKTLITAFSINYVDRAYDNVNC